MKKSPRIEKCLNNNKVKYETKIIYYQDEERKQREEMLKQIYFDYLKIYIYILMVR